MHLHELRDVGDKVLINGASGAVGTACVPIAKHYGAEVTGVCSTDNVALVKSIGADRVIDYKKEDFTKDAARYDMIVDTVGTAPYARSRVALKHGGKMLVILGSLGAMLSALWSKHEVIAGPATERLEDLELMARLASEGHYKPVIDRVYPLEQIVEAHRRVDSGRKRGNVVVSIHEGAAVTGLVA